MKYPPHLMRSGQRGDRRPPGLLFFLVDSPLGVKGSREVPRAHRSSVGRKGLPGRMISAPSLGLTAFTKSVPLQTECSSQRFGVKGRKEGSFFFFLQIAQNGVLIYLFYIYLSFVTCERPPTDTRVQGCSNPSYKMVYYSYKTYIHPFVHFKSVPGFQYKVNAL